VLTKVRFIIFGGEWVKFGFFIPTGVQKPQSPYNYCLFAAYKGQETRELVKTVMAVFFEFANQISASGGMSNNFLLCSHNNTV
jgi:hypothetical protein